MTDAMPRLDDNQLACMTAYLSAWPAAETGWSQSEVAGCCRTSRPAVTAWGGAPVARAGSRPPG